MKYFVYDDRFLKSLRCQRKQRPLLPQDQSGWVGFGFFSDLQVQRSLPSLEVGLVATESAFVIPLGWQQVV